MLFLRTPAYGYNTQNLYQKCTELSNTSFHFYNGFQRILLRRRSRRPERCLKLILCILVDGVPNINFILVFSIKFVLFLYFSNFCFDKGFLKILE